MQEFLDLVTMVHKFPKCGIEKFDFIVSAWVQINPDNSPVRSALTFLLVRLNTMQKNIVKL